MGGENGQQKALEMGKGINATNKNQETAKEENDEAADDDCKKQEIEEMTFEDPIMQQGYFRNSEKLKEIKVLEERQNWGFFLFPTQINKIERKQEFMRYLEEIKAGTWIPPQKTEEEAVDLNDAVLYDIIEDNDDDNNEQQQEEEEEEVVAVDDIVEIKEDEEKNEDVFNVLYDVLGADYSVVEK